MFDALPQPLTTIFLVSFAVLAMFALITGAFGPGSEDRPYRHLLLLPIVAIAPLALLLLAFR